MRKARKFIKKHKKALFITGLVIVFLPILLTSIFLFYLRNRVYPGVFAANVPLGGKTFEEASTILAQQANLPQNITLTYSDQSFSLETSSFASLDPQKTAINALSLKSLTKHTIPLQITINDDELTRQLTEIGKSFENLPQNPKISLKNQSLEIFPGAPGSSLDTNTLKSQILDHLSYLDISPITFPITTTDPSLTQQEQQQAQKRAEKLLGKSIILKYEDQVFTYKDKDILPLLNPKNGYYQDQINNLSKELASKLDRPSQDPKLAFTNGKVTEFLPSLDGIKTNTDDLSTQIASSLEKLESQDQQTQELQVPVILTPPSLQTKDVNNLGIEKLIGQGISYFRGSITSRIHNLSIASSRVNGTLIAPGETFSFNTTVGDISKDTGYQEAYIIKDGRTILGDGGGVCQVSTTLFRAVLNAGLPVTERRAHAYRVGYYEQGFPPGLDATVYSPTTDFKFKNNTPGHILIETKVDVKNSKLTFNLYGTDDGRVSTIGKSIITEQTPPPQDIYQDDPTLPVGTTKQVDYKSWGAKVNFKYTVARNGEVIYSKTFYSNYQPWAAVYLVGTKP